MDILLRHNYHVLKYMYVVISPPPFFLKHIYLFIKKINKMGGGGGEHFELTSIRGGGGEDFHFLLPGH